MRRIFRYRPSPATAIALTALAVALGGVAYATIPDSSGTIHGCFKSNGNLRVVESAGDCRNGENALAWNQQGPPGSLTTAFAEEKPEVSTPCVGSAAFCGRGSFVDLGGPAISVTVPPSGLVAVVARADIHGTFRPPGPDDISATNMGGCIGLFIDSQPFGGSEDAAELQCSPGAFPPGQAFRVPPSFDRVFVDWFTFEVPPGPHTISLRYRAKCLGSNHGCPAEDRGFFRNRKLWVTPIG
jgi:hypothetical protein